MKATAEIINTIKSALDCYRSDDYERASAAFRGCTPKQMEEEYGASGDTRQKILDGYKRHADAVKAAQAWIETESKGV